METMEAAVVPIYSYEELVTLWESGEVKKHSIIDQMSRLLLLVARRRGCGKSRGLLEEADGKRRPRG